MSSCMDFIVMMVWHTHSQSHYLSVVLLNLTFMFYLLLIKLHFTFNNSTFLFSLRTKSQNVGVFY